MPRIETALKAGRFLVIVHGGGGGDEILRTRDVLQSTACAAVQVHTGTG